MSTNTHSVAGSVVAIWRYPVKSMMGEELNSVSITERGLLGDRAYALVDQSDGKVASAKNPRKWPRLFEFRAAFVNPPRPNKGIPAVRITLPDGTLVTSRQANLSRRLSKALGRDVTLECSPPAEPGLEEYWPDMDDLDHRDTVTDEAMAADTFFDAAAVHLLTTTTLDSLRGAYPEGRFEVRRFRPNIVLRPNSPEGDFAEDAWLGRTIRLGEKVRISITGPCPRCVMTTLAQGDLPSDPGILRTAAKQHRAHVGVYAKVLCSGVVKRGDPAVLET